MAVGNDIQNARPPIIVVEQKPIFGLDRADAARSVCVGVTLFDEMVKDGRMPKPKQASKGRVIWDVDDLRAHFKALPEKDVVSAWDAIGTAE